MTEQSQPTAEAVMKPQDWASDQEVRWCPGCGDYAILRAVQRTLSSVGARPENTLFVSGIGCSSRFPYYLETYGFHSIHGRAPAVATGVKLANPDLDVWVVTGDGDGLSIGGNHTLHLLRRNLDVQLLLFNNEIYGLTKGQFSPTSRLGTRTPTSREGSVGAPVNPCAFALGAGGRFIARTIDTQLKQMEEVMQRAYAHKGTSFIEIYQNCVVFNDGVFDGFTNKKKAPLTQLHLQHGQPMLFADGAKGIALCQDRLALEVIDVTDGNADRVLRHDETNRVLALMLVDMPFPEFPVAQGVIYCDPKPTFEEQVQAVAPAAKDGAPPDLATLLEQGQTWRVKALAAEE